MINKLKRQIIFVIVSLSLITLLTLLVILINSSRQDVYSDSYRTLDTLYLLHFNDSNTTQPLIGDHNSEEILNTYHLLIEIDSNNEIIEYFESDEVLQNSEVQTLLDNILKTENSKGVIREKKLVYKWYDENTVGLLDYTNEESYFYKNVQEYVVITLLSLTAFSLIGVFISHKVTRPISEMIEKQKQFVMDASHELKSPLTVIKSNASILLSKEMKENKKWVNNIDAESDYMQKLVENLLELSDTEAYKERKNLSLISLTNISKEVALKFDPVFYENGLDFLTDIEDNIEIKGDETLLKRLLIILLDNARKYSHSNTEVSLILRRTKKKTSIQVKNSGEVITKDKKDKIFDRFFKLDNSRTRSENSHGLGLSLAKEIVKIHHANIIVESSEESGTVFSIEFKN